MFCDKILISRIIWTRKNLKGGSDMKNGIEKIVRLFRNLYERLMHELNIIKREIEEFFTK